jgi:putative transposase
MQWLYQARKRCGLMILNYMITSNHIHLLVADDGEREVIPNSMQLVAGRTGQEYNQREDRKGVCWEDRYHATAVESGEHLARCMVYLDTNMVVPVWSGIHQSGLIAATMRSRSCEGRTY